MPFFSLMNPVFKDVNSLHLKCWPVPGRTDELNLNHFCPDQAQQINNLLRMKEWGRR
jgi:hypothetical protein